MRALAAQHLLPRIGDDVELVPGQRHGEHGAGGITDRQAGAAFRNPVAIGHAHAAGGAVPGEDHVVVEVHLRQIDDVAIAGFQLARVRQFQLLHHVGHPAGAKRFPRQHVDAARAEQRPHRHLDRAGVGRGYNRHAVALGQTQNARGFGAAGAQQLLAQRRAVRAAERAQIELGHVVARALGARARREIGDAGFGAGHAHARLGWKLEGKKPF